MLSLILAIALTVSPNFGSEPQKVKVRFKLETPTEYPICVWFDADGAQWKSCRDGDRDRLFYERTYSLDAGKYEIWIETRDGLSEKVPVVILER